MHDLTLPPLPKAILANAQDPTSLEARATLAAAFQTHDPQQAPEIWEAAVILAAARGEFFNAIMLLRLHLDEEAQRRVLQTILRFFLASPPPQATPWSAKLPPRPLNLPTEHNAQMNLALQIGRDLQGVELTPAIPKPPLPVFADLPEKLLQHLLRKMTPVPLLEGMPLLQQGENEQACYLLSHGRLRLFQRRNNGVEIPLSRLRPPALVGTTSLLTTAPHRLSATADEPSLAWRIDLPLFSSLSQRHPVIVHQLRRFAREHLHMLLLRFYPQLMSLPDAERDLLLQTFLLHSIEPNGAIIQQGQISEGIFIPAYGEALVFNAQKGGMQVFVADLQEGDICGAASFWNQAPSEYTILLPEGGFVFQLRQREIQILQQQAPHLFHKLSELRQLPY